MQKVLYFDVEYANSRNKSICQLGLLSEYFPSGEPIFPEKSIYINPEDGFQTWCTKIHGITENKVKNEPNFPIVWENIKQYFTDSIIIGHNVFISDLLALSKSCARYGIQLPSLYYIDTLRIATDNIPYSAVKDFSLASLCKYFDIDTATSHDAFDDACATSDLFKQLVATFNVDIKNYIKPFCPQKANDFIVYVSDSIIRSTINEFYGIIQGFTLDNKIVPEEEAFIKKWKKDNEKLSQIEDFSDLFKTLNEILEDNIITLKEINKLKRTVKLYYETIFGSQITNSLQELRGILKGIIIDNKISTEEGFNLLKWLYKNINLSDYYPYNKILPLFETILEDDIITEQESKNLIEIINSILTPVESFKTQLSCVCGKHVCLSGNFAHGKKSEVEKIITQNGGYIDSTLKKTTDILIIGDYESQAYAYGNYGKKTQKAMEINSNGGNIILLKETDFFAQIN